MYFCASTVGDIFKPETVHDVCTTGERQQIPPSLLSRNSEVPVTEFPSTSPRWTQSPVTKKPNTNSRLA